jgi:AcrR family transcriptional regulator
LTGQSEMPRVADHRVKIDLLRAAEAVFAEHGLAAAKVETITARAGVSKGAFYLHFDSKEDCWRRIIEGFLARLSSAVTKAEKAFELVRKAPEQILALAYVHDCEVFEFCWQNRVLLRMLLGGGGGVPYAYLIDEFAEHQRRRGVGWIRRAVESGLYRSDIDPVVVAALLSGAYDRLARELIKQERRPDIGAWCRQVLALVAYGLFSESHRPESGALDAVIDQSVSPVPRTDVLPAAGEPEVHARGRLTGRRNATRKTRAPAQSPVDRRKRTRKE